MKKNLFLVAAALAALVSCTSDEFVGENTSPTTSNTDGALSFSLNVPNVTRADKTGADAATALGNKFYVYGIKGEKTDGAGAVGTTHTVLRNNVVEYGSNTAYTTTSNTKDWEYVGKNLSTNEAANITANDGTGAQTIKYWDYGVEDYTFYAFSAKATDIDAASPTITVVKNQTETSSKYLNGYTATISAGADIDKLFFSERVNIPKSDGTDRTAKNTYGGNVTFRFHNAAAKIRVAMYETIGGYSVKINKFTVDEDADASDDTKPAFEEMVNDNTTNFAANLKNAKGGDAGTLTVTYYDNTVAATENHPILTFAKDGGVNEVLTLGNNLINAAALATSISAPTYDTTDDPATTTVNESYTSVYPNKDNAQNLKLKLSYTLTAVDNSGNPTTGETITVTDATAEIPAAYLQWKPGYAYTYIFKISQNTNGSTGQGVVGLYPITFDAVSTVTEDGIAEYITTVSEPSITTFGAIYNSSDEFQAYVADESDYKIPSGTDKLNIYATIMDNSNVADFTFNSQAAGGVNVYKVTSSDATNFPVTEASVAEALAEISSGTKKITCTPKNADGTTSFSAVPAKVTTVPGEDGVDITIKALKLSGIQEAGQYAIEYVKTPATYHTTEHTYASAEAVTTAISGGLTLYKNSAGTTLASSSDWEDASTKFYSRDAVQSVGVYTYKIITVTAAP